VQRKGRVGQRQSHTHSLKEKARGWNIGYQERKGALLKQVVKIAKGRAMPRKDRSIESLSEVTGPSFLSLLSYISFHPLPLSGERMACNSAHVCASMCWRE